MTNLANPTGQKFGRLTILSVYHKEIHLPHRIYKRLWVDCLCECGNFSNHQKHKVVTGHTKSCGCIPPSSYRHGFHEHPLYAVWEAIVQRCTNPKSQVYSYYGGRGIKMCDEWRSKPESFISWALLAGWKKGLTIERNDVNGNYEPGNCSIATWAQQSRNTRRNKRYTFNGKTLILKDWAKELGISLGCLERRRYLNWPVDRMFGLRPKIGRNQYSVTPESKGS